MAAILNITSADNPKIKHIRKLIDDKEYRYEHQEFIIEGYKIFESSNNLKTLIIRDKTKLPASSGKAQVISVPENIFKKLADTQSSQGVLGICSMTFEKDIFKTKNYIYLDKIQDPGNMGTIIRSAAGFGFEGMIIGKGCVDPFMPKVVRATMGAIFKIKIIFLDNIEELSRYNLLAADSSGVNIKTINKNGPCILAIGNESNGISKEIRSLAKQIIAIPITNNIESLNASVSAGILMYELSNK